MVLDDRVALVTGAGQGIGRGIALALAAAGATVAVVGRTPGTIESVAGEIVARGGSAAPFTCDVTDESAVSALVAAVAGEFGGVDVLV
ncbi:SDR family NAD(P)-dependent oxidoreductase, partial [Gordonia alkanivorans]